MRTTNEARSETVNSLLLLLLNRSDTDDCPPGRNAAAMELVASFSRPGFEVTL